MEKKPTTVNLFEDLDIQSLKAEIVPANILYPYVLCNFGKAFFSIFSPGLLYMMFGLFVGKAILVREFIAYCMPMFFGGVILASVIWPYSLFKYAIAPNMKHGAIICSKLTKVFRYSLSISVTMLYAVAILDIYELLQGESDIFSLWWAGCIIVIGVSSIASIIISLEAARLGLSPLLKNINKITGGNRNT